MLILVDRNPLRARVELASCLLMEAACFDVDQDLYLDEAGWHLSWAFKLLKAEAHPDPLAVAALDELLPLYQEMCASTPSGAVASGTPTAPP